MYDGVKQQHYRDVFDGSLSGSVYKYYQATAHIANIVSKEWTFYAASAVNNVSPSAINENATYILTVAKRQETGAVDKVAAFGR